MAGGHHGDGYHGGGRDYRHHGGWYGSNGLIVALALGDMLAALPPTYKTVYVRNGNPYYYNNVYYQQTTGGYMVVSAPAPAVVVVRR